MWTWSVRSAVVLLALAVPAGAQRRGARTLPTLPTNDNTSITSRTVLISGRVVIDDGTELTEPAAIQTICHGRQRTETHTDSHGNFSFGLGGSSDIGMEVADAGTSSIGSISGNTARRDWKDCQLQAVLAGFSSEQIELEGRITTLENTDLGRLPLHRLQRVQGTSISVTSALAPQSARKALDQALDQEKHSKWDAAQKSLQKAVKIYPKYAQAWFELGRAQLRGNNADDARKSFEQSMQADPEYVNPYDALARLAFVSRDWRVLADITRKLLVLNPVNFVDAYFFSAVANYYLNDFDAAEKVAHQGVKVDEAHQVPRLRFLLGILLAQRRDYQTAAEYMQQYVAMETDPAAIEKARKELAKMAQASAAVNQPLSNEKK